MLDKITTPITSFVKNNQTMVTIAAIVIIVVIIGLLSSYFLKDKFANILGSDDPADFDIIFFMNPGCGWCTKQIEVLTREGTLGSMTIKDISKEEDKKEAQQYGVKGFPYFISRRNKSASMGFHETTQELLNSLKVPADAPTKADVSVVSDVSEEQFDSETQGQGQGALKVTRAPKMALILLTSNRCGHCTSAKEDIAKKGIAAKIVVKEESPEEYKKILKSVGLENSPVPLYINTKNGKTKVGFAPIEQVMKELA